MTETDPKQHPAEVARSRPPAVAAAAEENIAALRGLLDLHPEPGTETAGNGDLDGAGGSGVRRERDGDYFVGPSIYKPDGRVFGGQVLAQCVMAAAKTMPDDRRIHSLHGYFLRPGDVTEDIGFGVERLRDGRSFSARRVHAYQKDAPILSLIASFQREQPGLVHYEPMPEGLPGPMDCRELREILSAENSALVTDWINKRPFEMRPVEDTLYAGAVDQAETQVQHIWFRAAADFGDDPVLNAAALAYASDFSLLEPALRRHRLTWTTPGLRMASLDHAMWWHRPVHVDEWMLYVQESPAAQGGRALGYGRIYARTGELLATVAQEGMLRVKDPAAVGAH